MSRKNQKNYEVVDDLDDGFDNEQDADTSDEVKPGKAGSDTEFDDLPNAMKFDDHHVGDDDEDEDEDLGDDGEEDAADRDSETSSESDDDTNEDQDDDLDDIKDNSAFRKRLMRERRLREEAEADAEAHRKNFNVLNKRINELDATIKTRASVDEWSRKESELNTQLSTLRSQKKAAIEAGDTDNQILIDEQIADVISDIKLGKRQQQDAADQAKKIAEGQSEVSEAPNRHVSRWMRQHGQRYRADSVFRAAAMAADREVAAAGFDKDSKEYFDELNRRLSKPFPEQFKASKIGRREEAPRRQKPPVTNGEAERRVSSRKPANDLEIRVRGNKARLTKAHFKIMRAFNMDPDSPSDVNTFVRENLSKKNR